MCQKFFEEGEEGNRESVKEVKKKKNQMDLKKFNEATRKMKN